jgi:hypothetical protein
MKLPGFPKAVQQKREWVTKSILSSLHNNNIYNPLHKKPITDLMYTEVITNHITRSQTTMAFTKFSKNPSQNMQTTWNKKALVSQLLLLLLLLQPLVSS